MSREVGDAIAEVWKVALGETAPTPQFARRVEAAVTAEIARLQAESVNAPAALYGRPGREPICDFDCDYCHQEDDE